MKQLKKENLLATRPALFWVTNALGAITLASQIATDSGLIDHDLSGRIVNLIQAALALAAYWRVNNSSD